MKFVPLAAWVLLLLVSAGPIAAQSSAATHLRAERERIEKAQAAAEARFNERQRECLTRFIATSCVEDAKRERRETVTRLKHEQMALDEKERKDKAAARLESIQRKTQAASAPNAELGGRQAREPKEPRPEKLPRAPRGRADAADGAASAAHSERPGKSLLPKPQGKEVTRSAEDVARKRSAFEAAQRAAEAHRAEVEARNAARAAKKKPAAPLPLPPGASAP